MPIFAVSSRKVQLLPLTISEVTGLILIKFTHNVATILPLNIFESELRYSYPFWNASLRNVGHFFANFAQNWLPWQHSMKNRKSGPD